MKQVKFWCSAGLWFASAILAVSPVQADQNGYNLLENFNADFALSYTPVTGITPAYWQERPVLRWNGVENHPGSAVGCAILSEPATGSPYSFMDDGRGGPMPAPKFKLLILPGTAYDFGGWVKPQGASFNTVITFNTSGGAWNSAPVTGTSDWTQANGTFTSPASYQATNATTGLGYWTTNNGIRMTVNVLNGVGTAYVDDLYVKGPVDTTEPNAIAGLAQTGSNDNSISMSWSASNDNTGHIYGYKIYRNNALVTTQRLITETSLANTYTDTGLISGSHYTYQVTVVDLSNNESPKGPGVDMSTTGNNPPAAPTAASATKIEDHWVTLTWSGASDDFGVTGYNIYNGMTKVNGVPIAGNTFEVGGLTPASPYTFTIAAVDGSGVESMANSDPAKQLSPPVILTTAVLDATVPTLPVNFKMVHVDSNSAIFTWSAASDNVGVTAYQVFQNGTGIIPKLAGTSLVYLASGLSPSTSYTFTLQAEDHDINVSGKTPNLVFVTPRVTQKGHNLLKNGSFEQTYLLPAQADYWGQGVSVSDIHYAGPKAVKYTSTGAVGNYYAQNPGFDPNSTYSASVWVNTDGWTDDLASIDDGPGLRYSDLQDNNKTVPTTTFTESAGSWHKLSISFTPQLTPPATQITARLDIRYTFLASQVGQWLAYDDARMWIPNNTLDVNNDGGYIDITDVQALHQGWLKSGASKPDGDITGPAGTPDGKVDMLDFAALAASFQ